TKDNAHPHYSQSRRFIIVHNGVIENYEELRTQYLADSYFYSQTDTEVIIQLVESFSNTLSVENAILTALKLLEGSYALLILDTHDPDTIYAAKNKSPLVLGKGKNGVTIASDVMALVGYADEYFPLLDKTFIVAHEANIRVFNLAHEIINVNFSKIDLDESQTELGQYQHYMLKEIYEQPAVIRNIMSQYLDDKSSLITPELINKIKEADRLYIIAAGTSMHAGLVGKKLLETFTGLPVETYIASEFAYDMPILSNKPFFILNTQSGETADLRACLVNIKALKYPILTITNVKTSTLAREADYHLELFAGPEIAVASTKAFIAQISVLAILANTLAINPIDIKFELARVANSIEYFLDRQEVNTFAHELLIKRNCFFIGRGLDYYTALEAALKLKEVSYIQAEGFAAGELKHGTIALIEQHTPAVAIISNEKTAKHTRSNLNEMISRGATPLVISLSNVSQPTDQIILDDVLPLLSPMVMVVPTQLITYYAALERGLDIDKPRNLAKSVTVE
ncbi:MAG: glutamine--fructose-6-phosphate transaminase (isomerizing), partial [Acholeplasmataceae bacterium]